MKRIHDRSFALCLLCLLATLLVVFPAAAQKKEVIEEFRAFAVDPDTRARSQVTIRIYEWTADEDRDAVLGALKESGGAGLAAALNSQSDKGTIRFSGQMDFPLRYAREFDNDGKRGFVLATDRPVGFGEASSIERSARYNVSLVMIEVDPASGKGEGTIMGGVEVKFDSETNRIGMEGYSAQPITLNSLTLSQPKKKKNKK